MAIEVTVAIEPAKTGGKAPSVLAVSLFELGGTLVSYRPEMNGAPALATFEFSTEAERGQFITDALQVPGVSLTTHFTSANADDKV